jgi:hypothetical protein
LYCNLIAVCSNAKRKYRNGTSKRQKGKFLWLWNPQVDSLEDGKKSKEDTLLLPDFTAEGKPNSCSPFIVTGRGYARSGKALGGGDFWKVPPQFPLF